MHKQKKSRKGSSVTFFSGWPGEELLNVLWERRDTPTVIRLASGEEVTAYKCEFGAPDLGDEHGWSYVRLALAPDDFTDFEVYMSDVEAIIDPESGAILRRQTPAPEQTPRDPVPW